jgi:hypothetical protein
MMRDEWVELAKRIKDLKGLQEFSPARVVDRE